ncbi:hypothetical protein [Tolypothrix sp. VBCCA 56010]|uniref:hypothetical protein n=1 Tax=Tolypothrix sp. VBCCA 56010 TaxID=3137731 RepID=UPI003D7C90F2
MAYIFHYGDPRGDFAVGLAQAYGQQVAQAAQRRQSLDQQSLAGQLEQAQGQLARTQEIGLRGAMSRRERADQQAFTRERDATEQQNRLAAQANQFQLRQTADDQERALRRTQYGELIKRFPEMAQDPEAAIAELDYLEGRGLGTFQSIRARREAAAAKQGEMRQRGEAAANLYDVSAAMPDGVLPADQAGPPTPEGQAGLARRGATMEMLRTNPALITSPGIRSEMGTLTPGERNSAESLELRRRQEERLEQQAAASDPVFRELRTQRDLASRELARALGNKFLGADELAAAQEKLRAAQERVDERLNQLQPPAPNPRLQQPGMGGPGAGMGGSGVGQDGLGSPSAASVAAAGGIADGTGSVMGTPGAVGAAGGALPDLITLKLPDGSADEVPQAFVADLWRLAESQFGVQQWPTMTAQQRKQVVDRLWLERKVRMGKASRELLMPQAPPVQNSLDEITRGMMAGGQ